MLSLTMIRARWRRTCVTTLLHSLHPRSAKSGNSHWACSARRNYAEQILPKLLETIVVKAVRQDDRALDYASQKLQRIGRSAYRLSTRWSCFGLRFSGIAADREIVVKARRQDDRALDYASQKFAADREIGVEAVDKMVVLWITLLRNCSGSGDRRKG